jgi:MFS transporter, FHS family, L-fucose permease
MVSVNTNSGSQQDIGSNMLTLRPFVVGLFFCWGFATVLVDTLIPRLKALFTLSYAEVMLTQFCFFAAYFLVSIPAGVLIARVGYVRGIVIGLVTMVTGCLLFVPASSAAQYELFLLALFVMASGITVLQVAANPLIALLGTRETSHSRLNLAQAFNSLGTFVGPFFGAWLILSGMDANAAPSATALKLPFVGIAMGIAVMAVVFAFFWRESGNQGGGRVATPLLSMPEILQRSRLAFGALSIFVYVGAEVSIGSVLTNYLMDQHTLGLAAQRAGQMVAFYWGGAMVGRLIGSAVMRTVSAGVVLAACALGAALLVGVSALSSGALAAYTAIAVGLCNSIMFPTIFTLSIEGLGLRTPQGAGLLCLAIVGGAIVPLVTGVVADHAGLSRALLVPAICYVWIATYGWWCHVGRLNVTKD